MSSQWAFIFFSPILVNILKFVNKLESVNVNAIKNASEKKE